MVALFEKANLNVQTTEMLTSQELVKSWQIHIVKCTDITKNETDTFGKMSKA